MNKEQEPRIYFEEGKFKLRKFRHDMTSALSAAENMIYLMEKSPEKRAAYDSVMKQAITRLKEIRDSIRAENFDPTGSNHDVVEISKGT